VSSRPIAILVLIAAAAAAIAGCGGGSPSSSSSGEIVAPKGAPFSFTMPSGFEEVPGTFPGEEPEFLTLVIPEGVEGRGNLNAYEWKLGAAEKRYPAKRLLSWIDEGTQSFYRSEGATLTPAEGQTIAGHPAVCWQITAFRNETEGAVDADSCAIVAGHTAVEQSCSWKPETRVRMQQGCEELRRTLKVSPGG
jgi:hypothetical protein